jgi:hypothetical protein
MDNFENLILVIDEIVDEGYNILKIILNLTRILISLEYITVIARATMKDTESVKLPANETSFSSVIFFRAKIIPGLWGY